MRRAQTRSRARARVVTKAVMIGVGILVCICACDMRRDESAILDECNEYVSVVAACLGGTAAQRTMAAYSAPPHDRTARDAMRARCGAQRDRMKHACR